MTYAQIAAFVNAAAGQSYGETGLVAEDLSNVIQAGQTLQNAQGVENFARTLPDVIGKQIVESKTYKKKDLGIEVDGWEFGSILQKIRIKLPETTENASWDLQAGRSYDPNVFNPPEVEATYWNNGVTFEVQMSITNKQVKSAFKSAAALAAFVTGIHKAIENSLTVANNNLERRLLCNQIAETVYQEYGDASLSSKSTVKAVNLLYLYNQAKGTSLTAADALYTAEFLKFAAYTIAQYKDYITDDDGSTLYNIRGINQVTTDETLRIVMLSAFAKAIGPYSLAPAYNEQYLKLPDAKTLTYWQGTGTAGAFADRAKVYVTEDAQGHAATVTGVLAVMFDKNACVHANENPRVTAHFNEAAEFTNEFHKTDAQYLVDDGENFVVFLIA